MIFTDDTSIIVINYIQGGIKTALNNTIYDIMSWLKVNFLLFNFSERYYFEFRTKNYIDTTLDITTLINLLLIFHVQRVSGFLG